MKEKRRRAVQFSKAGLEVPDGDQPFKRKGDDGAAVGTEPEIDESLSGQEFSEDDSLELMIVEREVLKNASFSFDSSQRPVCGNKNSGSVVGLPAEEVFNKSNHTSLQGDNNIDSLPSLRIDDGRESTKSMVCFILRL
jgi:ATP-dependent RNA helicase DHX37/DHR1